MRRSRSPYPPEFKEEAFRFYRFGGRSIVKVAIELGVAPEWLRLHSALGNRSPDDYERSKLNLEPAAVA